MSGLPAGLAAAAPLPVGTEFEILAWIKARYKVLGELYAVDEHWEIVSPALNGAPRGPVTGPVCLLLYCRCEAREVRK